VSIADSPLAGAYRILTGRFSEVDELRALADIATARTKPGIRTNSALRALIKADPAVRSALSTIGMNPDTLKLENPPGVSQFPTSQSVNLSRVDADVNAATGLVVEGPNTSAALARRAASSVKLGASAAGSIIAFKGTLAQVRELSMAFQGYRELGPLVLSDDMGEYYLRENCGHLGVYCEPYKEYISGLLISGPVVNGKHPLKCVFPNVVDIDYLTYKVLEQKAEEEWGHVNVLGDFVEGRMGRYWEKPGPNSGRQRVSPCAPISWEDVL